MKSTEKHIALEDSDFYVFTPRQTSLETFLYPLRAGRFHYQPGYRIERNSFDSFLILYIEQGSLDIELSSKLFHARSGEFVLIDCYEPHSYWTSEDTKIIWLHFDGKMARAHYDLLKSRGPILLLKDPAYVLRKLTGIYDTLKNGRAVSEPLMSRYITDILTELIMTTHASASTRRHTEVMEQVCTYIAAHIEEPLPISQLAERSFMSEYYFIKVFKRHTGFTPHAFIANLRISTARYLLLTGNTPLDDIRDACGFSNTSAFCAAFKKQVGMPPLAYRKACRAGTREGAQANG